MNLPASTYGRGGDARPASERRPVAGRAGSRRPPRSPGGYVLLVTLGLLVLSTTLLVAVGRAAAQHAVAARAAQSELQSRWAVASCRAAVLPRAEQILISAEQIQHRPTPSVEATVRLGDDSIVLVISDEQAKANVNTMIDQFGVDGTEDRLRQAMSGNGTANHIRLRPAVISDDGPPTTQPASPTLLIFGPGQIFDSLGPEALLKNRPGTPAPMQVVTCWGTGQLNVLRADEISMRAVLMPALTRLEISRMIAARNKTVGLSTDAAHPGLAPAVNTDAIGILFGQSRIDPKVRNRLSVSTRSACHSLRLTLQDRQRVRHWLTITDESNPNRPQTDSIVW